MTKLPSSTLGATDLSDLTNTPVTDAGLAELSAQTGLRGLWLTGTEVTDKFCRDPDSAPDRLVFNRTVGLREVLRQGIA